MIQKNYNTIGTFAFIKKSAKIYEFSKMAITLMKEVMVMEIWLWNF